MMNIKTIFLSCFCFLTAFNVNAEWVMEKNTALDLCNEYLAYLNRKPVDYYFQGMKPDAEFKGLSFPEKTAVKLEEYQHVLFQNSKRFKSPSYENWDETIKALKARDIELFLISTDVNHDGIIEKILEVSTANESGNLRSFSGYLLGDNGNLLFISDAPFVGLRNVFNGEAFDYKGRVYLSEISTHALQLYKPGLPWKQKAGVGNTSPICSFKKFT